MIAATPFARIYSGLARQGVLAAYCLRRDEAGSENEDQ
jgi:hypothetical protein